jgi:hypothetical protein
MVNLTPGLRKLLLTAHVTFSVGWLGALAVFFAHAVASLIGEDAQMVRAADLAMGLTAWFVILPLCIASLMTGLVQSMCTPWGLLRHYWILAKFLLTAFATIVLLLKLGPIKYLADVAAETASSGTDLTGLRISLMVHAVGGLLVLLGTTTLAVYKPRGMTRYGVRQQRKQSEPGLQPGVVSGNSTPRWVKVSWVIAAVLVLMMGIMMFGGDHGPGAHMP